MQTRKIATLVFLVLLCLPVAGQAISVSQSLDRSQVAYEDSLLFEISLQWDGPQYAYLFDRPLNPVFDRLQVRGFSSSIGSTGSGADEVTTKKYKYVLIPTSSGQGRINAVTISYMTMPDSVAGELLTEPMAVTIAEPIPVVIGEGGKALIYIIVAVVIIIGVIVVVVIWRRSACRPKEVVKTPVQQILEDLTGLKATAGTDLKKFQTGLHDILLQFMDGKYGIDASSVSDEELAEKLAATDLGEGQRERLWRWFVDARKDKFRPVTAELGETIRRESEIRNFFVNM
jgi:hypothetical protein